MVYNLDCRAYLKTFGDKTVDHVITSPPYNRKRNDKYEEYDDNITDYYPMLSDVIKECLRVTKGWTFFNIQKTVYNKKDVFKLMGEFSDHIQEIIIWEKSNPMPANGNNITNAYEFFIVLGDTPLKSNTTYTKNHITTSVNSSMPPNHKAVMKQEVCDWFVERFTKPNDLIVDPFAGMGTTGISCVKNGRRFLGCDISQEYCIQAEKNIDSCNRKHLF